MLSLVLLAQTAALAFVAWLLVNYLRSPLRSIPGPLLAKFSDVWRLYDVWCGHQDVTQTRLHRAHGDVVRIGPNTVSISDPAVISSIYGGRKPFNKGDFYLAGATVANGKRIEGIFNTNNEDFHEYQVRPIKGAFTLTNILKLEPLVDNALDYFVKKLRAEYLPSAGAAKAVPIGELLRYFAWDVVCQATFSERLGVLDGAPQMRSLLQSGATQSVYLATVGQMPVLEKLLNNPRYPLVQAGLGPMAAFSAQRLGARIKGVDEFYNPQQTDLLQLFIDAETDEEDANQLTRRQIGWTIMAMVGGSDTTATPLRSAVYYVARDRKVQEKLVAELRETFSGPHPDFRTCQSLPYLDAVVKETLRIEPSIGVVLERVVPAGGLHLPDGRVLPEGTTVGLNPRVVGRDKRTFGEDADQFVPERWLRGEKESEADFDARLSRMKAADFTFSYGKRGCLGRNLATLEIYKCVSRLFFEFDISLAKPDEKISSRSSFFLQQFGIDVVLKEHSV